tara:strand:- start:369 stop:479 length:111 start_codon:yes stop_codon:yes gene_type:complete
MLNTPRKAKPEHIPYDAFIKLNILVTKTIPKISNRM